MTFATLALRLAAGTGLALALACSGSSSDSPAPTTPAVIPPAALALVYADPAGGTVKLVKDAALSSGTHLVLAVVGTDPDTLSAGLMVTLNVEPTVAQWTKVKAGDAGLVENGAVYDLGAAPQILKAKASGGTLTFVVGQKGFFKALGTSGVLAKIALDLQPGTSSGRVVFNAPPGGSTLLTDTGALATFAPSVGSLNVQ